MPRLFTGLEIPAPLAAELASLRGGLSGARWLEPDLYHLTLRFIGDVDGATARDVADALDAIVRPGFGVTLDGVGAFGGDRPRAIVAHAQASAPLIELQAEHERALRRVGLAPESRKFTPHVTLARLRRASALAVADFLESRGGFHRSFEAARFVLFSAREQTGGGPYLVEAAWPLG
jgi:2'-5' RNA ligase